MIFPILLLSTASPAGLLIWCAIGFAGGIWLFFRGFRLLQRRRLILDTPFSKIRSASMGTVEVSGLAVGPYNVIAPITGRPCYYYRTLVSEYKQQGKNKQWVRVAGECMHVPFFVDDNTGRLLVDPRGADLDLHRDFQEQFNGSFFSTRDEAPGNVNSFLSRHGVATMNRIKVEEYCIKPKNSLFILGTLSENPGVEVTAQAVVDEEPVDPVRSGGLLRALSTLSTSALSVNALALAAGSAENDFDATSFSQRFAAKVGTPPQVIRLSPEAGPAKTTDMTQQQKIAAALMKAGISNPAAWSAAGLGTVIADASVAGAGNGQGSGAEATNGFEVRPPTVLGKGVNNKTFLISWRSQREVARSLAWKCTLMIWGGPALALVSLYFFLGVEHLL
ncbi:MAG TPA: GIDE domain-containing protein [Candidatus Sulfotelmatobacter sp.]|nr:GIDE domain-containing protein [Candidatus Sulfotelmatobacter sp.]